MRWLENRQVIGNEKDDAGNYWTVELTREIGPHRYWWARVTLDAPAAEGHHEVNWVAEEAVPDADLADAKSIAACLRDRLTARLHRVRGGGIY